ncbi:hypothetical protein D3C87_1903590 [compost metagenome]
MQNVLVFYMILVKCLMIIQNCHMLFWECNWLKSIKNILMFVMLSVLTMMKLK